MLYEKVPDNRSLNLLIKAAGAVMTNKLRSYKKDHIPESRCWDPSLETQEVLSKLKSHNDKTESAFGVNGWLNRILPNMTQVTQSAMIEFSINKTMQWLKDQAEEQKRCLIIQAWKTRQHHEEQMRRDAKSLMEKKVLQRAELVEQGDKKREKAVAIIDDLRKSPLIASYKQFE